MSLTLDPNKLTPHPLLAGLPAMDQASAEFESLKQSVADRGVDYPVIIDEQDRILDGRNRTAACALLGIAVPVVRRESAEASEIIISALVNRRHLPKGALAYLAAPLLATAAEAGRARRMANLKRGVKSPNPTQSGIAKTVEQLATELGFSADLYEQALKVRKLFTNTAKREWRDGAKTYTATAREWFEPKILSAEIGLGGVIQALAGKDATEGKTPEKRDLPTLLRRGLDDLKKRFARWESLAPATRQQFTRTMAKEAAAWPEDVRQAVLDSLEQAAATPTAKPQF